jgi:hypothetical protein
LKNRSYKAVVNGKTILGKTDINGYTQVFTDSDAHPIKLYAAKK